ncbi:MAG: phosphoglycerate dehydrogenase [Planctomycetes bacterium]|nr:phosphoglycerate dehydrogenase [Planctomycetota bacterium]
MPVVLITPEVMLHKETRYVEMLNAAGFDVAYPKNPVFTRGLCSLEETIDELSVCDAVIAGGEVFSKSALAALPKLRVIARSGVGYDKVDVAAATAHKVVLTITPTANHESVAEHALMLLLATAKRLTFNDCKARAGEWPMQQSYPIRGTTIGILGLGRIGRSFAIRAGSLGAQLIATETNPNDDFVREHKIELVDFDELLARSDYLSIHCPLNDETRGRFDQAAFAKMKPDSILINTARGGLVVESELIVALESGHLRGAGLDCFEQEPPSPDNPLFQMEQVVCTPHIAGSDTKSQDDMGIEAADCIIKLHSGEWPADAVINRELQDGWKW